MWEFLDTGVFRDRVRKDGVGEGGEGRNRQKLSRRQCFCVNTGPQLVGKPSSMLSPKLCATCKGTWDRGTVARILGS